MSENFLRKKMAEVKATDDDDASFQKVIDTVTTIIICHHEAGHAVVGYRFEIPGGDIHVDEDGGGAVDPPEKDFLIDDPFKYHGHLMCLAAGWAASMEWIKRSEICKTGNMRSYFEKRTKFGARQDTDRIKEYSHMDSKRALLSYRARARASVRGDWDAIEAMAAVLAGSPDARLTRKQQIKIIMAVDAGQWEAPRIDE